MGSPSLLLSRGRDVAGSSLSPQKHCHAGCVKAEKQPIHLGWRRGCARRARGRRRTGGTRSRAMRLPRRPPACRRRRARRPGARAARASPAARSSRHGHFFFPCCNCHHVCADVLGRQHRARPPMSSLRSAPSAAQEGPFMWTALCPGRALARASLHAHTLLQACMRACERDMYAPARASMGHARHTCKRGVMACPPCMHACR